MAPLTVNLLGDIGDKGEEDDDNDVQPKDGDEAAEKYEEVG